MLRASRRSVTKLTLQPFEKRFARPLQLFFQTSCAVASVAGPGLGTILVAAFAAVMRVLHTAEIEILFPIRPLFLKRSRAVADFHPTGGLIWAETGVIHVAEVFAFRDGAMSEGFGFDRLQQVAFAAGFYAGSDEITHSNSTLRLPLRMHPIFPKDDSAVKCGRLGLWISARQFSDHLSRSSTVRIPRNDGDFLLYPMPDDPCYRPARKVHMKPCTVALFALLVFLSLPARAAYTTATVKGSYSFLRPRSKQISC